MKSRLTPFHFGLSFEKNAIFVLSRWQGLCIRHSGGCGDGGIDFRGHWFLDDSASSSSSSLSWNNPPSQLGYDILSHSSDSNLASALVSVHVLGQCKANQTIKPSSVREFAGTIAREKLVLKKARKSQTHLENFRNSGYCDHVIGIFVAKHSALSNGTLKEFDRLSEPMFLAGINEKENSFESLRMNDALRVTCPQLSVGTTVEPQEFQYNTSTRKKKNRFLLKPHVLLETRSETLIIG